MRLLLEFRLEENKISLEYRKFFLHFIKDSLFNANNGKYYNQFYNGANTKNYTFAIFLDKPQFQKEEIVLQSNRVKMLFSTSDKMTGFIFYSSFLERKKKKYPMERGNAIQLFNVRNLREQEIGASQILVKTNAPLVIRKHTREQNKDYYYSFEREEFLQEARQTMERQLLKAGFPESLIENLSIQPVKCRKVIVTHYGCKMETTVGTFLLEGNQTILSYFVQAGIGSRKSEGFGMLELLAQDI